MSEAFDTMNIRDVFATSSHLENAGGGNTRIYNCITKNGVLIPVGYSIVFPTVLLLKTARTAEEFARRLAVSEMFNTAMH